MSFKKDSVQGTILVALAISLVCSVVVSVAAIKLKPVQELNKALDRKKNILMAAGLYEGDKTDVAKVFSDLIRSKLVDLKSGNYVEGGPDPEEYDQYKEAKNPKTAIELSDDQDVAGIRRIAPYAVVYEVIKDGGLDQVVLPVHGKGLWSTLYGYIAVSADTNTIKGLGFYEHGETPGLGGEVDNPKWKALWAGKKIKDAEGKLRIEVVKGAVDPAKGLGDHQIDGLSGATITGRGVSYLVQFWLGSSGFAVYLDNLKERGMKNG